MKKSAFDAKIEKLQICNAFFHMSRDASITHICNVECTIILDHKQKRTHTHKLIYLLCYIYSSKYH